MTGVQTCALPICTNYEFGKNCGVHIEPGPDGGIVVLDDTTIYDMAVEILQGLEKEA